jgi:hypothetical protein
MPNSYELLSEVAKEIHDASAKGSETSRFLERLIAKFGEHLGAPEGSLVRHEFSRGDDGSLRVRVSLTLSGVSVRPSVEFGALRTLEGYSVTLGAHPAVTLPLGLDDDETDRLFEDAITGLETDLRKQLTPVAIASDYP